MKRADYERQKHNKKKHERELHEKKQHRRDVISYNIVLVSILLLIITIILLFTVKTENPLLLMGGWCILYDRLCAMNRYNTKIIKKMFYIPIIEVLMGIVLLFLWIFGTPNLVEFLEKHETGLIIIILIFSGLINGVSYYYYNWLTKK